MKRLGLWKMLLAAALLAGAGSTSAQEPLVIGGQTYLCDIFDKYWGGVENWHNVYEYDDEGRMTMHIEYYMDTKNECWWPRQRKEYDYNAVRSDGKKTRSTALSRWNFDGNCWQYINKTLDDGSDFVWSDEQNGWVPNLKQVLHYSEGGKQIVLTKQRESLEEEFKDAQRTERWYDESIGMTWKFMYYWGGSNNPVWCPSILTLECDTVNGYSRCPLSVYFAQVFGTNDRYRIHGTSAQNIYEDGRLAKTYYYYIYNYERQWPGDSEFGIAELKERGELNEYTDYTYTDNETGGYTKEGIRYNIAKDDEGNTTEKFVDKDIVTYDSENREVCDEYYIWSNSKQDFELYLKNVTEYDEEGRTVRFEDIWKQDEWDEMTHETKEFSYDELGRPSEEYTRQKPKGAADWMPNTKKTYEYGQDNSLTVSIRTWTGDWTMYQKLHYVGQNTNGIEDVAAPRPSHSGKTYNLQGIAVGDNYRGIVIKDGKKILIK